MLKMIELNNVGPAPKIRFEFGERLNLLTGDNGLGKSFLLDISWWTLTRKWPAEVNPSLPAGKTAIPSEPGETSISYSFKGDSASELYRSSFSRKEQTWVGPAGRPSHTGLVLYAMADGSFAVWDPARNYWRTQNGLDVQDRPPAYVFNPSEVWDGLQRNDGSRICNGLVLDWAMWQKERGEAFKRLKKALLALSPSESEPLTPGGLTRISLDDSRDIPTIRMPYGHDVPVLHASAGMRRIMSMAYLLIWLWTEHRHASQMLGEPVARQIIFLVDEVEAHLHPKWQFTIIRSLMDLMAALAPAVKVQLILTTHSPQVMASVEPFFNQEKDAWFDFDYTPETQTTVTLTKRRFEPQGDVSNWLTSQAFDLVSARSPQIEALLKQAAILLEQPRPSPEEIEKMRRQLIASLNPKDDFLYRWRAVASKKGLLT